MIITISTINLNNSKGLKKTIESFKPLRHNPNIDFVFQDGKSTDDSINVASSFYTPEEIVSDCDGGIYDAMNRTLKRAKGKYIIWINSGDEIIAENWISIIDILRVNAPDILISAINVCETDGCHLKTIWPNTNNIALEIGRAHV
jgi:glycosyltransferase involved in cell wall biosynthesis